MSEIRVIDADTVDIDGARWRLAGIDAPESRQTCRAWGRTWACGVAATEALRSRAAGMSCAGSETDRYGRSLGVCSSGGEDLGAWLVVNGWALAYRQYAEDYTDEEDEARSKGRGMHRGAFVVPWDWRRGERLGGEDTFSWIASAPIDAGALADRLLQRQERGFRGQFLAESVFGIAEGGIAVSFGARSGANPALGGVWRGSMTGVYGAQRLRVSGDAVIGIDDFTRPAVDISFGNFEWPDMDVVPAGIRDGVGAEMRWENLTLAQGAFRSSGEIGSIEGQFYGQEEVGGVFERNGVVGAFGAARE